MSGDNDNNGGNTLGGGPSEPLPPSWASRSSQPRVGRIGDWSGSSNASSGNRATGESRFGSLGSMGANDNRDDDDEDDEGERRETYFAGGDRSGISIQGPGRPRENDGANIARDLLRRAAEGGPRPETTSQPRSSIFSGGGHTLGGEDMPSEYIPDPNGPPPSQADGEVATHVLTFWRNGFSIDDGELRSFDDPEQARILAELRAGRVPPDVIPVQYDRPIDLQLNARPEEDYKAPPRKTKIFGGSGNRLGAPVPEASGSSPMPGGFPPGASSSLPTTREAESISTKFEVDQTKPTTSVQIRLADGTRLVARVNLTHTVQDIRNFIEAARPENRVRTYTISTGFPNRVLEEPSVTIEGAGLKNSVVIQKWA